MPILKIICLKLLTNLKKLSIIFVTHKLNKLKYFDKIIYMEKGKVINQGDLKSLLRNNLNNC